VLPPFLLAISYWNDDAGNILSATNVSIFKVVGSTGITLALLFGGFLCDVLFIGATRQFVKWAGLMESTPKIVGIIALNLLLSLVLFGPGFLATGHDLEASMAESNEATRVLQKFSPTNDPDYQI
jgi:hypothetical protein